MEFPDTHVDLERILNFPRHYTRYYLKQTIKLRAANLREEMEESFKFCFVRNPFSWYESYWRFMCGKGWEPFTNKVAAKSKWMKRTWHPNAFLEEIRDRDFNIFTRNIIDRYPGYLTQMYGWYAVPGKIDFVGRTERMASDLVYALKRARVDIDEDSIKNTGRVNESPDTVERPTWDEEIKKEIYRLEYPIFKQYGYAAPDEQMLGGKPV